VRYCPSIYTFRKEPNLPADAGRLGPSLLLLQRLPICLAVRRRNAQVSKGSFPFTVCSLQFAGSLRALSQLGSMSARAGKGSQ